MLANRLPTFAPKFTPIILRTRHNVLTSNPVRILDEFRHRLTTLYSALLINDQDTGNFLQVLSLPWLSAAHTALMDRDIQISKLLQCIKDLRVGKWPGPDGFTTLYYRKLADVLAPHLTAMYNSVKSGKAFSADLFTANIVTGMLLKTRS